MPGNESNGLPRNSESRSRSTIGVTSSAARRPRLDGGARSCAHPRQVRGRFDRLPGEHPTRVVAVDPRGRYHKVRHHAGNPDGTYEDDSPTYWGEISAELAPAAAILVFGHGSGKANASHHWVSYVEKHRPDIAAKLVADVRVDSDHLDERQVLRLAQIYFGDPPHRDPDGIRGAPGG